jgi:hypothetical protein
MGDNVELKQLAGGEATLHSLTQQNMASLSKPSVPQLVVLKYALPQGKNWNSIKSMTPSASTKVLRPTLTKLWHSGQEASP